MVCFSKIISKVMVSFACVIILIHAVVPHHHHDFDNSVCFVFQSKHHADMGECCHAECSGESECCNGNGEEKPLGLCKLQQLLSQLVLSNREDDDDLVVPYYANIDQIVPALLILVDPHAFEEEGRCGLNDSGWPLYCADFPNASALRAPPAC